MRQQCVQERCMGVETMCKCFSSWDPYVPPGLALNPFSNSRQFPSAHGAGHQPRCVLHTVSFNSQAPRMKQCYCSCGESEAQKR